MGKKTKCKKIKSKWEIFLLPFVIFFTILIWTSKRRESDAILDAVLGDRTTNCPFHNNYHILHR